MYLHTNDSCHLVWFVRNRVREENRRDDPSVSPRCVPVWLRGERRLVSGLSARTTSTDVVRALLRNEGELVPNEVPALCEEFALLEQWRGCERLLPERTRILRLWWAWGGEQSDVRFVLVRKSNTARTSEAKVLQSILFTSLFTNTVDIILGLSPEKQRRVVHKAFRKLATLGKSGGPSAVRRLESLVHLVLSQDHDIRQQLERISELDSAIEQREAEMHACRIQTEGENYLQAAYLSPIDETQGAAAMMTSRGQTEEDDVSMSELEACCQAFGDLIRVEEDVMLQESRAQELQKEIEQVGCEMHSDAEMRLTMELEASTYVSQRLEGELHLTGEALAQSELTLCERHRDFAFLIEKLRSLEVEEEDAANKTFCAFHAIVRPFTLESPVERNCLMVPQCTVVKPLGAGCGVEALDDDSDTGLSSMHSDVLDSFGGDVLV
uniref:Ras-associating domain-containing protein n=1 Tax=Eptatretus burgeri TaxID=7764 RepID=A0A8C4NE80_EPTBU